MDNRLPVTFTHRSLRLVRVYGPEALSRLAKGLYVVAAVLLGLVGLLGLLLPILPGVLLLMLSATLLGKVWPAFGEWLDRQRLVVKLKFLTSKWRSSWRRKSSLLGGSDPEGAIVYRALAVGQRLLGAIRNFCQKFLRVGRTVVGVCSKRFSS